MKDTNHTSLLKNIRVDLIFCMMGFSAMVGQILLLRRLMAVFSGNELVVGAVFFGWVFWAGLGNLIMGRVADRTYDVPHLLSLIINLTALMLPATVLAASMTKVGLGYPPPQLVGLPVVLIVSAVVLAPFCFLVGAALTVAAKLPATGKARDIGIMYLFDALGAGLGGIVATWFAIRIFTPLQIALLTTLIMVFFNSAILVRKLTTQALTALIALLAVATLWIAPGIDALITETKWEGYHPIVDIDSRYGNLVITEQGEEHTLFADGVPQFSTPFPDTYETEAILPLIMHSDPKDVLVIDGGLSGTLANWRSINLESITYVQVDPDVTTLEERLMTSPEAMKDERLRVFHVDAPHFIRRMNVRGCRKGGCFDVVILNTGDPDTAAASRLLTKRFFKNIKQSLRPNGVLLFGVFQPGNAIGPEAAKLLGTVRSTVGDVFEHLIVLPFDKFYFITSPSKGMLTDDPKELKQRLIDRAIVAPVLENQHIASTFPERIQSLRKTIDNAAKSAPMNTELKPAAYFNGMLLWASRTGGLGLKFLYSAERLSWLWFAAALIVAAAASILLGYKRKKRLLKISSFWMLFSIGFAAIIYEIVLLVYYQLQKGLLFYQLGIIITAFMVGLSCGAFVSIRIFQRYKIKHRYLIIGLLIFAAYQPLLFFMSGINFALANFICGVMEGFMFEATAEWMVAQREKIGRTTGWLNCADYWGSAIGSVLASIIAVPLLGLVPSMFIAAALPLTAALVLSSGTFLSST